MKRGIEQIMKLEWLNLSVVNTIIYIYIYYIFIYYIYTYIHIYIIYIIYIYIYILYIYIWYIYIYIYMYGMHHWLILWSSYKKLAWMGFESMTTEFHSDTLADWAIRPWVQLVLRANFVQLFQFHCLFSVTFHFCCLPSSVTTFILIEVLCR